MKISELKILIETMENIGAGDCELYRDEGRDGDTSFTDIRAKIKRIDDDPEEQIVLVFY